MSFTSPVDTVQAILTSQGRNLLAYSLTGAVSIQLVGFKVGRGGYDVTNPVKLDLAALPNLSATALLDPVYPAGATLAPLVSVELPINNVAAAVCRLNRTDATWGLGELGVYCRVVRAVAPATDTYTVGSDYLFGLAHFPLVSKNSATVTVWRIIFSL